MRIVLSLIGSAILGSAVMAGTALAQAALSSGEIDTVVAQMRSLGMSEADIQSMLDEMKADGMIGNAETKPSGLSAEAKAADPRMDTHLAALRDYVPPIQFRATPVQFARDCISVSGMMAIPIGMTEIEDAANATEFGGTWPQAEQGFDDAEFWRVLHQRAVRVLGPPPVSEETAERLAERAVDGTYDFLSTESEFMRFLMGNAGAGMSGDRQRTDFEIKFNAECQRVRSDVLPRGGRRVTVVTPLDDPRCVSKGDAAPSCPENCETKGERLVCPVEE